MNKNAIKRFHSSRSPTPLSSLSQQGWSRVIVAEETQPQPNFQLRLKIKEKVDQEDYLSAISLLNQLIDGHPDNAIDYNNRGLMYLKLGKYDQAMADFDQSITLNPRLDRAYNNRANCQAIQGNLTQAIADYEMALDLNPYNQRVWINQGITLRELEQYELAVETLEIALIMGKQYQGRIYAERGYTHYLNGDWNWAIADYQNALANLSKGDRYYQKAEKWLAKILQS